MNTNSTHLTRPGQTVPTMIDLTAERLDVNDGAPSDLMLLELVIGVLLVLGVALLGLQIG